MLEGFRPLPVSTFGSLITSMDPEDLPVGLSSANQNVEFFPGGVRSRGGFVNQSSNAGTARILSLADFIKTVSVSTPTPYRVLLDDGASLRVEQPEGTLATVDTLLGTGITHMKCASMNNRVFMAFSDGKYGMAPPRQWDGTNFDQLGHEGCATLPHLDVDTGGSMTVGWHRIVMAYESRNGYVSIPCDGSGAELETPTGSQKLALTLIPLGPPGTIRRRFYVTPAYADSANVGTDYYTHPDLWINDNTTTTVTFTGVSDAALMSEYVGDIGFEKLLKIRPLPVVAGLTTYKNRLIGWGARADIPRLFTGTGLGKSGSPGGLQFDSGTYSDGLEPSGWSAPGAGGALVALAGGAGSCYKITGDGATATRGLITNGGNLQKVLYLAPWETTFYARFRAKKSSDFTGNLVVQVVGTGGSAITLAAGDLTTSWTWCSGLFFTNAVAAYPTSYVSVSATGTPANNSWVAVEGIYIWPASEPTYPGRLFVSEYGQPETFIAGDDSELPVNEKDGQRITCCYELRGVLRVAKEHGLWSVTDNGDLPAYWAVENTSTAVGTPSLNGVALGDGWAVIADTSGLYLDTGAAPEKISQEIQPTWDTINWNYGHLIKVAVDMANKRVFVLAPTGSATYPTTIFVMDFVEGFEDPVASSGHGRKWTTWTIPTASSIYMYDLGYFLRDSGTRAMMFAGGYDATTAFIVRNGVNGTNTADTFKTAVLTGFEANYQTAMVNDQASRTLFGYFMSNMKGAGTLKSSYVTPAGTVTAMADRTLASAPDNRIELPFRKTASALALKIAVNPAGATTNGCFSTNLLTLMAKPAPFSPRRGY